MTVETLMDTLATRNAGAAAEPLTTGATLVVAYDSDYQAGEAFIVPANGVGTRALTTFAERHKFDVDALAASANPEA